MLSAVSLLTKLIILHVAFSRIGILGGGGRGRDTRLFISFKEMCLHWGRFFLPILDKILYEIFLFTLQV